jgi:hypothetical protein
MGLEPDQQSQLQRLALIDATLPTPLSLICDVINTQQNEKSQQMIGTGSHTNKYCSFPYIMTFYVKKLLTSAQPKVTNLLDGDWCVRPFARPAVQQHEGSTRLRHCNRSPVLSLHHSH